jgi:hypothetical protein
MRIFNINNIFLLEHKDAGITACSGVHFGIAKARI